MGKNIVTENEKICSHWEFVYPQCVVGNVDKSARSGILVLQFKLYFLVPLYQFF